MRNVKDAVSDQQTRIVVLTSDSKFERFVRATFAAARQIDLVVKGVADGEQDAADLDHAAIVVADIGTGGLDDLEQVVVRVAGQVPLIAVTDKVDEVLARRLLQLRVSDLMLKPMSSVELMQACVRVTQARLNAPATPAKIHTFLAAAGGVGLTTVAIETALLLLGSGRTRSSTCLIDLDFQHGSCADYLDLEPRLDLEEIEPRPERLDRQLLEIMLSYHASGLAVIAAPSHPAEMRSFDPDVVIRLLDLVSTCFDHVVIDMPRTWFPWTDNVLVGSDDVFIVTEMTVPGLRHVKQLLAVVGERLGEKAAPRVIVNRFQQSLFRPGLRRSDLEKTLGPTFAGTLPNNYALTREAIDRGVPLNDIKRNNNFTTDLRKIILAHAPVGVESAKTRFVRSLGVAGVRQRAVG